MRVRRQIIFILLVTATVLCLGLLFRHVHGPRVVARATTPDGVEMCLVQRCNWSGEPFTTSFVYRKPGGNWRWFYYDHQDSYWGASRVSLDTNARTAVFYRGSSPAVTFAWPTESYTLHRRNHTSTEPQQMPVGWSPLTSK